MTGEKNRFTTTEKLWKLNDETLSTPEHDEMVIYLLSKENILKTVQDVRSFMTENISNISINHRSNWFFQNIPNFWNTINNMLPIDETKLTNEGITAWKQLLEEYNSIKNSSEPINKEIKILSEKPIFGNNNFIVGYWDVVVQHIFNKKSTDQFTKWIGKENELRYVFGSEQYPSLYIEVKPKIKSFGETLRQLKTYQLYVPESVGRTILFTKDMRFSDAFESQGIKIINANDFMTNI